MASAKDYARLQRANWDELGANALARELFNLLNAVPAANTTTTVVSDGSGGSGSGTGVGSIFEGTIVSGTGATYTVTLDTGDTVTATHPQIDSSETIPAGTITPVYQLADGTYRLANPVWG